MPRVGWMSDTHQSGPNDSVPGPQDRITQDLNSLFNSYGSEHVYIGGDLAHPEDKTTVPHLEGDELDEFWKYVDKCDYPAKITACPGNHDVPIQHFLQSDEDRTVLRGEYAHGDSLRVYLMNTVPTATVTGSPGITGGTGDGQGGIGVIYGRIPYADLLWLDDRLTQAPDTATKVVMTHHHVYFSNDSNLQGYSYSPDDNFRNPNNYWVCLNHEKIHDVLSSHSRVIVPQNDVYQFSSEGYRQLDGVYYLWKKHYYKGGNDSVHTYAYIDGDSTGATVTTVDHSTGSMNTILDVAW